MVVKETGGNTPKELKSNLGKYWNNGTIITDGEQYVLAVIEAYGISHVLRSIPQYGFNRDMKEFDDGRYEATQEEMNNDL